MRKILITGSTGQIGSRLCERLDELFPPESTEVYLLESKRPVNPALNSRNKTAIPYIYNGGRYDVALHLAANIHTRYCDKPEYQGDFIRDNVLLTERVANAADRVIFVSSDNVFSGMDNRDYRENDPITKPANFYGVTKSVAERIVLERKGAVIRIQSMLGVGHNLIVDKVLDGIDGKDYWPFWTDQFVSPSFFNDFFNVVKKLENTNKSGVYHVSCTGEVPSRAKIAQRILEVFREYNLPMQRTSLEYGICDNPNFPRRLVLDTIKTREELGIEFTDVNTAIANHVLRLRGKSLHS